MKDKDPRLPPFFYSWFSSIVQVTHGRIKCTDCIGSTENHSEFERLYLLVLHSFSVQIQ